MVVVFLFNVKLNDYMFLEISIRVREELIKLIDMLKPDVVFLQEIKCQNNEFLINLEIIN